MTEQERLPLIDKAESESLAREMIAPMRSRVRSRLGLDSVPETPPLPTAETSAGVRGRAGKSPEKSSHILEQLQGERRALSTLMHNYETEYNERIEAGWIGHSEREEMENIYKASDTMIRETLAAIENEGLSLEDAKKRLAEAAENLPVVRSREEEKEALEFFLKKNKGGDDAQWIEDTLRAVMAAYFDTFQKEEPNMKDTAKRDWIDNILSEQEEEMLAYMDEVTSKDETDPEVKKKLNKGMLRVILSNLAAPSND